MSRSPRPNRDLGAQQRNQPRQVSKETHDRCLRACREHAGVLTDSERNLLSGVAATGAANLPVSRRDLDHAMGILGRLNNPAGGRA